MLRKFILVILAANICLSSQLMAQTVYGSQSSADEVGKMVSQLDIDYVGGPNYKGMAIAGGSLALSAYALKKIFTGMSEDAFGCWLDSFSFKELKAISLDKSKAVKEVLSKLNKNYLKDIYTKASWRFKGPKSRLAYEQLKEAKSIAKLEIASMNRDASYMRNIIIEAAEFTPVPTKLKIIRGGILGALVLVIGGSAYYIIDEAKKVNAPINDLRVRIERDMRYLLDNDPAALLLYVLSLPDGQARRIGYSILSENGVMNELVKQQVSEALSERNIEMTQSMISAAQASQEAADSARVEEFKKSLKDLRWGESRILENISSPEDFSYKGKK